MMTTETIAIFAGIFLVVLILSLYIIFWFRDKQKATVPQPPNQNLINLRLGAYERLVILAERISLPSLISRLPAGDLTVRQIQAVWTENIKHEFDYNLSQQIYVSKEVWQALNNLREQNIFIINQMANTLPHDSRGTDLGRNITELLRAEPKASLHPVVIEALNFEARQLL